MQSFLRRGAENLYTDELHKMFDDEEAIWLDEETEKGIHEIVETAETQAESIKSWGFGSKEVVVGE